MSNNILNNASNNAIEIKNLSYIYSPGTTFEKVALKDINMSIKKGEFIGLIGHTGSGKSTLVQHLNALLKPTAGSIFINDEDIYADKSRLKQIRSKVGLVFQYPEHQLFELTIFKDVAFGPKNMQLPENEINTRVELALEMVGIAKELHQKSPFELSGGQKRRVAIAGVLAMKPDILILDEPTAGLDPKGRDEILSQIKAMHENLGITVILVSHSMEDIARLADKIFVISDGQIVMEGTCEDIFYEVEKLEALGLGSTASAHIAKKLLQQGFDIDDKIYTVQQIVDAIFCILKNGGKN